MKKNCSQYFSKQNGITLPIIMVLVVMGLLGYLVVSSLLPFKNKQLSSLFPKSDSHAAGVVDLSLSPSQTTTNPNQTFTVNVNIDAHNVNPTAAQLNIKFDPTILQLVSFQNGTFFNTDTLQGAQTETIDNTAGVAAALFTVGPEPLGCMIKVINGLMDPSQCVFNYKSGTGTVAVLQFKALKTTNPNTTIRFDATNGLTVVSALNLVGDQIGNLFNADVVVNNPGVTPTPASTPTITPTPTPTPTPKPTTAPTATPTPTPVTTPVPTVVPTPVPTPPAAGQPTVSASPLTVGAGGTLTISWNNSTPAILDWVGINKVGTPDGLQTPVWGFTSSCLRIPGLFASASGSCSFTLPSNLSTGNYEARYYSNNSWTVIARNTFTVSQTQPQPTPTPVATPVSTTPPGSTIIEAENMSLVANSQILKVITDTTASGGKAMIYYSNATSHGSVTLTKPTSQLIVTARGDQCKGSPSFLLTVDGTRLMEKAFPVSATIWTPYTFTKALSAGSHNFAITFTNDYLSLYGNRCDRNLLIDKVTFQ